MWHGIVGHDRVVEQFRHALGAQRLASSFLFCGPAGIGKRSFALRLAQALLCQRQAAELLDPCEGCPACVQVMAGSHPDVAMVAKPAEKSFLPLELIIGDKEHRMREGLCQHLALRPLMGGRKIAIIDDADYLNAEGANSLLKTLEEPPPLSLLILVGTSPARQLPTIRSRCQLVRFQPLPEEVVAELLLAQGVAGDRELAQRLAAQSEGSLERGRQLADEKLWQFREQLFRYLAEPVPDSVSFAKTVAALVEEAGREASARRERLRQVVRSAVEFYRQMLRQAHGGAVGDAAMERWVIPAVAAQPGGAAVAERCLERCLDAERQIERNANQATLIESWLDALAEIGRG